MRHLRWKRSHLTGSPPLDARNQGLVRLLGETADAMRAKERCQDMNDLYADLVDVVERRLVGGAEVAFGGAETPGSDAYLRSLLDSRWPLPAKDTPACRSCGICEDLKKRLASWTAHAPAPEEET